VSDGLNNDFSPVFDPRGRYLYFLSTRQENPTFSESELNFATLKMTGVYAATLSREAASPFAPRSDEGVAEEKKTAAEGAAGKKKDAGARPEESGEGPWKAGASAPIRVDLEGLMGRAVRVPVQVASIQRIDARDDRIFYLVTPSRTIEGMLPGEKPALRAYDLKKRKDSLVVEGTMDLALAADGTRVLYKGEKGYLVADTAGGGAGPGHGGDDGPKALDLSHMKLRIDPRQEWREMFGKAWRLERDFFYSTKMNGVDWAAVRESYASLLPLAGSRGDLNYLIGEMLGELGNSHTYVGGGDEMPPESRIGTAFLGTGFAPDRASGRYRLSHILEGDNTRESYRAPLRGPGVDAREGDFVLAIDGADLTTATDPSRLLVGKQSQTVRIELADSPGGKRREVVVQPVKTELSLREKDWIDHNRAVVDRLSHGQVGYIFLSDMSALGMEQFIRQFYPQLDRKALLIDDRWNGGGFIDQMVLERLRRVLVSLDVNRQRTPVTIPAQLIAGPKACLINHYSASDGDLFPFHFRRYGLGPLIGTRTWGGVRGIRGPWSLLDGGYVTIPEESSYGIDSQWVMENHGVDPDITVDDTPEDWLQGRDPQLEAGVAYLLDALKKAPQGLPPPPPLLPAYPPGVGGAPPSR